MRRPAPLTVSPTAARRFLRAALGLDAPHRTVAAALEHHGFVQLDPINVCGRMQDLVLRNRVAGYREHDLLRLAHGDAPGGRAEGPGEPSSRPPRREEAWQPLAPERRVAFEQHVPGAGVLAVFPLRAWPYLTSTLEQRARRTRGWAGRLPAAEERLARRILAEIGERGPLTADDIAHDAVTPTAWGTPGRLVKNVLEKLFVHGRVLIATRRGFRRIYDLPERVLPAAVLGLPRPPAEDVARFLAGLRVRQRRLVALRKADLPFLGEVLAEVRIAGCPPCACLPQDLPALSAAEDLPPPPPGARLLAPLDPLVYDRRLTAALWGFEYTWEVYTPPARRLRGYYALPVLAGERLVGHVEPRADREAGRLQVVSRRVGRGVALTPALKELAGFLGL